MVFSEVGNGSVFLWMFEFFMFVIWFWLLITIFGDLFRDHETSGVTKALWIILILFIPFFGILLYLIVRGNGMSRRAVAQMQDAQKQMDDYIASYKA